eukprot:2658617-Alexandrium_andersonii.AAC.1
MLCGRAEAVSLVEATLSTTGSASSTGSGLPSAAPFNRKPSVGTWLCLAPVRRLRPGPAGDTPGAATPTVDSGAGFAGSEAGRGSLLRRPLDATPALPEPPACEPMEDAGRGVGPAQPGEPGGRFAQRPSVGT